MVLPNAACVGDRVRVAAKVHWPFDRTLSRTVLFGSPGRQCRKRTLYFFDLDPTEQVWYMTPSWRGPSGVDDGRAPCVSLDRAPRERIPATDTVRLAASP